MKSTLVFPKIFPPPTSYNYEEPVWVNPTQIVRVDYPLKQNISLNEVTFVWNITGSIVGPTVPSKLIAFRSGQIETIANREVVRPGGSIIVVNAASVWAIQPCFNGTRLYLAQTGQTLEASNGILVLRRQEPNQIQGPDSAANAVADVLGIQLGEHLTK